MTRKHIVVNGASRMNDCAEFIKSKFVAEGYDAQSLTVNDPNSKGMLVQIRNATSKAGSIAKGLTGLGACATLKLSVQGSNLELEVLGGKWIDKAAVNVVSWIVLWPLFITSGIGMWRQKKLLDRVFIETMTFFTTQRGVRVQENDSGDGIEHRTRMQLYNEISPDGQKNNIHIFSIGDKENGQCIGVELSLDGKSGVTVYIAPQNERKANLILNLGEGTFDNFVNGITKHSVAGMEHAYPLFIEALKNGANDYYTRPALVRLADCAEPRKRIWCLVMQLQNIDIANDFTSEYVMENMGNLLMYVNNMLEQLINNKVSLPDNLLKIVGEAWDGYKIKKIAFNVVSILSGIFGDGSIIGGSSDA